MRLPRRRHALAAIAGIVLVTGAAAGCTGEDQVDLPTPIAPQSPAEQSPTPSPTSTLNAEEAAIVATYEGYVEVFVEASLAGDSDHPRLDDYLTEPELSTVRGTIDRNESNSIRYTGSMTLESVEVTGIVPGTPNFAWIEACIDFTEWRLTHLEDGSPAGPELPRYRIQANLIQFGPQDWRITKTEYLLDKPC